MLVLMGATLGMREGELFGLLWDCVDFKRRTVAVAQQLCEDASGQPALQALQTWLTEQKASGHGGPLVFTDTEGNPLRKEQLNPTPF